MHTFRTKRQTAIDVMSEYQDLPMSDVLPIIAEEASLTLDQARGYYWNLTRTGQAPGIYVPKRTPRALPERQTTSIPEQTKNTALSVTAGRVDNDIVIRIKARSVEQAERFLQLVKFMPDLANMDPVIESSTPVDAFKAA